MKKVALLFICTGHWYWPYAKQAIESARKFFLPEHQVDYFLWTDIPEGTNYGATVFPTAETDWPLATLMRYHFFLQQEETLKNYDYLFFCDVDMEFVDVVGNEILGDGLTATEHPSYAYKPYEAMSTEERIWFRPFERNPESAAYLPLPEHYFAGGFQGGKTPDFLKAMRSMKRAIDGDFVKNYTARWNDESHWNRYLWDNPPAVILDPSYCYPQSALEFYRRIWGRDYKPKLQTVDKAFRFTTEQGAAVNSLIANS